VARVGSTDVIGGLPTPLQWTVVIQSSWRDRHCTPPSPRSTCVTRVPLERGSLRSVLHAIAASTLGLLAFTRRMHRNQAISKKL